jgi:site-specific recombinase XerD
VVRAVLLVEDVALLVERGVAENKLMSKLKDVAQFKATWAESRATAILVTTNPDDVDVVLEHDKDQGKQADLRLVYTDPPHQSNRD